MDAWKIYNAESNKIDVNLHRFINSVLTAFEPVVGMKLTLMVGFNM